MDGGRDLTNDNESSKAKRVRQERPPLENDVCRRNVSFAFRNMTLSVTQTAKWRYGVAAAAPLLQEAPPRNPATPQARAGALPRPGLAAATC